MEYLLGYCFVGLWVGLLVYLTAELKGRFELTGSIICGMMWPAALLALTWLYIEKRLRNI